MPKAALAVQVGGDHYKRLTKRQQAYLARIHAELVSLGLVDAVAA